jgi:AraC-like DNA-binding protein
VARCAVSAWLAPFAVGEITGFVARSSTPVRQIEVPFAGLPLIVSFGPRFHVSGLGGAGGGSFRSFIAGLHENWVFTEFVGESAGMQLNLNPLGAYALLGRPLHEIANRTVGLEDLLGVEGARLGERLGATASWEQRFALLETALRERLQRAKPASEAIAWAWRRLESSAGRVRIGALADTIGCSRKHLVAQFREQIGLPPKRVARVLRFQRARDLLRRGDADPTNLAVACGYYDQSHLHREFRELAGMTPGQLEGR